MKAPITCLSVVVAFTFSANVAAIRAADAIPRGGSPIAVKFSPQGKDLAVASTSAATVAKGLVGRESQVDAPRHVTYEDRLSFGPQGSGAGWLTSSVVSVSHGETRAEIRLSVIVDGTSGDFVAAFTERNEAWFVGTKEPLDIEKVARDDGWVMGQTAPNVMQSTASEVVTAAWEQFGVDPRAVGQMIVRPRWISAKFPAKNVDGELVPIRPTEKVWLVQICGTKLHPEWQGDVLVYSSGEIMQFRDGTLEYVRGFPTP